VIRHERACTRSGWHEPQVLSGHHPVMLARDVVTLDHLSGGRVELGLGAGNTPAEFTATVVPMQPARQRKQPPSARTTRSPDSSVSLDSGGGSTTSSCATPTVSPR